MNLREPAIQDEVLRNALLADDAVAVQRRLRSSINGNVVNINLIELYEEVLQEKTPIAEVLNDTIGYVTQSMTTWLSCGTYDHSVYKEQPSVLAESINKLLYHLLQDDKILPTISADGTCSTSFRDLFIWAILADKQKIGRLAWESGKNQIGAALIACALLKALAVKADRIGELQLSQDLNNRASMYERLSVDVVAECYQANKQNAHKLLVRQIPDFVNKTLFSLSNAYTIMTFMGTTCCQTKLNRLWKGNISSYTPTWKMMLCFFLPFFIPFLTNNDRNDSKNVCRTITDKVGRIIYFYNAPVIIFMYYSVSYLVFLAFFTLFVLTDLRLGTFSTWEFLTWGWVFTFFADEIRQLLSINKGTLWYKVRSWFGSFWNRVDLVMYGTFVLAVLLKFYSKDFAVARTIYSISLVIFIIRIIQGFLVSKKIGPKVIVLGNMLMDVLLFVGVFLVFLVSFGVMYQANLYPNSQPSWKLLKSIVYIPYWQLYGELFLEEMKGEHSGMCTTNESVWRPNDGENRCPEENTIVEALAAIYMLMSNILLVNLLIAMFSTTYEEIHKKSELIWRFYSYGIVHTLSDYPLPCPPFNLLSITYKRVRCVCNKDNSNEFSVAFGKKETQKLEAFEKKACETYLTNLNSANKESPCEVFTTEESDL